MLRYSMFVFGATLLVVVLWVGRVDPRRCRDCRKRYWFVLRVDGTARLEVIEAGFVFDACGPEVEDEVDGGECEADFEEHSSDFDGRVDNDNDDSEVDESVDGVGGECVHECFHGCPFSYGLNYYF